MSIAIPPGDYDEDGQRVWTDNLHGNSGSAHSVSSDRPPEDRVRALREVVAEVTHGRIPALQRRGPRF